MNLLSCFLLDVLTFLGVGAIGRSDVNFKETVPDVLTSISQL